MIASDEMSLFNVGHKVIVPLRYLNIIIRFASSMCRIVHLELYLLRLLTFVVMSGRIQLEHHRRIPMRIPTSWKYPHRRCICSLEMEDVAGEAVI
jgi:hypothetical protein